MGLYLVATRFYEQRIVCCTKTNLINYQGYGPEATHTNKNNPTLVNTEDLKFPLKPPQIMKANYKKDKRLFGINLIGNFCEKVQL